MKKNRSRLWIFIAIFCILTIFQPISFADKGQKEKSSEAFETKITYGFNKYYKRDREIQVPVSIEVKNKTEAMEGEVQVLFEKDRFDQKTLYEAYTQELDLEKGATKTIEISPPIGDRRRAILKVVDKEGNLLFDQQINFERGDDPSSISLGILSDDYDSLSFLGLINLKDELDSKDKKMLSTADLNGALPEKKDLLKALNVILINDYDTQNLNKKQIEALEGYVKDGGTLIVGTGSKYQKTLKGLADLNYFKPSETVSTKAYGEVLLAKGEAEGAQAFLKEGENPVAYSKDLGRGKTIILAFDLGEGNFLNWKDKDLFMKQIIQDNITISSDPDLMYEQQDVLQDMISYIPNEKGINVKNIIIIILVFLLVVGPINYLVLKKLDKSELSWITIPIISLAFTLAIYVVGLGSKFDEPLANNASIIELNNKGEVQDSLIYTGLFAFKEGNLSVSFKEDTSINLTDDQYINEMKFNDKDIVTKYTSANEEQVDFMKMGRWESKTIKTNQYIDNMEIVVEEFKADDKAIRGKIKNNSDLDLEEAILIYGGSYQILGDIGKKFTKEIDIDAKDLRKSRSGYKAYEIVESIYPWSDDMYGEKELLSKAVKQSMLQQALFNYFEGDKNLAILVAYNRDPIADDIEMNGKKPNRTDRNLIMIPIDIKAKAGQEVTIPEGVFRPKLEAINNLNLDPYSGEMYGDGDVTYSLKIDSTIDIKEMLITDTSTPDVVVYMYNYKLEEWEKADKATITLDEKNMDLYYKKDRGLRMKFQANPGKDNTISQPLFTVKGVGR